MRRRWTLTTIALIALIALRGGLAEAQSEVRRTWNEIGFVTEQQIALSLPDGTLVQGKAIAVRPDGLEMDVKKTSDANAHPKGKTTIPRDSISSIEVQTRRRNGYSIGAKAVGGAGSLSGLILGGVIGEKFGSADSTLTGMAIGTVAGAIGGVLVGQKLDTEQETILIRIIPETQGGQPAAGSGARRRSQDEEYWRVGSEAVVDSMSASSTRRIWPR